MQHHIYVDMTITRSHDQSQIFISQKGLPKESYLIIYLTISHQLLSQPFNQVPVDKPHERIKFLSIFISIFMSIMNLAHLSRPDPLLAKAYLENKAHYSKQGDHASCTSDNLLHQINYQSCNKNQLQPIKVPLTLRCLLGVSS